jgi:N-acetylneuraminic acid mutarotase
VFGGLHDFNVLQTIEKYDTISDNWVSVYFKLPVALAKLGAAVIDNHSVMICGGMSAELEAVSDVYCLDLQSIKWTKKNKMMCPRLMSSGGLLYSNGYAYAIGGNNDGICERFDYKRDRW